MSLCSQEQGDFLFTDSVCRRLKLKRLVFLILAAVLVVSTVSFWGIACEDSTPGDIVDDLGRSVTIAEAPERIVSLAPSCTEILFALGLGEKVVGVTEYCDYPEEAEQKDQVGGFSTVDLEKVAAADPDVIFAAGIHEAETIPALENLGYTVVALVPETVDDVLENIRLVGDIAGKEKEASSLVDDMTERIESITDVTKELSQAEKPHTLYVTWHEPIYTAGTGTFIQDLVELAGGINMAHDIDGHATISLESVVARNPDAIITCTGHGDSEDAIFDWARTNDEIGDTNARVDGRVYQIDSDLSSRGGPRIVEGLEWFAHFLHPDKFSAPT